MDGKLLAEWFWIDRWMGSSAFLLPMEPRGLYREMLTQAWRRGAKLPNDHEAIKRAVGATNAEWRRCWPLVSRFWREDGDALVNDTQQEVYQKCLAEQQAKSARARAGANARWLGHRSGNAQASSGHVLEQSPPDPDLDPAVLKDHKTATRGKVFVGSRLVVSQKQHACIVQALGAYAGYVDWMALYPRWDAELVSSGQVFDTLAFCRQKAQEQVQALRRGGSLFQPVTDENDDWFSECQRLHEGACGGRLKHHTKMLIEDEKRKQAGMAS